MYQHGVKSAAIPMVNVKNDNRNEKSCESNILNINVRISAPVLLHCQMDPKKQTSVNEKSIWKCPEKNGVHFASASSANRVEIPLCFVVTWPDAALYLIQHSSVLTHWPLGDLNVILKK